MCYAYCNKYNKIRFPGSVKEDGITIKAETLSAGGKFHKLVVYAWTPGSYKSNVTELFLVNLPPHGGACDVNPKSGHSCKLKIVDLIKK